nr:retrovirus-related Pol polyprotein from transposon TNT 1-94 [Tanacetum cinerariifolium]
MIFLNSLRHLVMMKILKKLIDIFKMVATRLHQPWIAIPSLLNRCIMGKDSSWDTVRLPILQMLSGIVHFANLDFASLIWDEFEWKTIKRSPDHQRYSKMHSSQDDHPITNLLNTTNGDYKFGMDVPDAMISFAIKKKSGTMASALICLANNKKFNFSKYIFYNMVKNLEVEREGKGFSRIITPLFDTIMVQAAKEVGEVLKVLDLEKAKTAQANEIAGLKKRVKKLERNKNSRTSGLKRLWKVGSSIRVESYEDKESDEVITDVTTSENVEQDATVAKKEVKAEIEEEERIAREKDEANIAVIENWDDVQATIDESAKRQRLEDDSAKLKKCLEIVPEDNDDEKFESTPLYSKSPSIVDYKICKGGKKSYFKIIRADENLQNYLTFRKMFKKFNREDLEVLRSIVKTRFEKTKLQWKVKVHNWKLFDSCRVYCVTTQSPAIEDPVVQSLLDLRKESKASRLENLGQKKQPVAKEGSSVAHNKYYSSSDSASDTTLYFSSSDESANETDDADESDMDLSNDNPHGDDDAASTEEKYTTSITKHYATRYYKEGIEDRIPKGWIKEVPRYHFEALNVRRSDDKEYEFSYADLPRLSVNDVKDIRRVIKNRVEDIQLRVESYQRTLNLTKPTMFFKGIDQKIPFTMTIMHKGVMYLNQYNIKSLMKLSEVKNCNKRLKGRDWTDYDVKSSREMLKKIDESKGHAIEESKDLTSLSLEELIGNLKVYEMIIKKDFEIVKEKVKRKSIALKAKKESSDEECSSSGSEDEEYAMAVRDFKKFFKKEVDSFEDSNHLIGECLKPLRDKNQRAFVGGSWSDSDEQDADKVKDEMCLVAHASSEVCFESSYFSDENSSIDDLSLDNEYDKLCKMSLKIITKNKRLKATRNSLENKHKELKDKSSTLKKNKGVDLDCAKFHALKIENEKLKEESTILKKIKKSTHCLNEMLSNQKPSGDKLGLGFNSLEASSSGTKEIKFVKAQKKASSDRGRCIREKGLYVMKLGNKPKDQICLTTIDENSTLWHRRLGHANMRLIQSLASKKLFRNLPKLKFDQHFCDACKIGKQAHASHKAKNVVSKTRCLELLHMDLTSPSAVWSYKGNRYTLVIVDDYSRYTWTRFLMSKIKAFDQFKIYSRKIQNQLGCSIVSIRTDHDREFDNKVQFGEFCNANGTTHNFSALRTPQSNGVVERKNMTLQEMSRTMLNEQFLPQNF